MRFLRNFLFGTGIALLVFMVAGVLMVALVWATLENGV